MDDAREAIRNGNYEHAISLLTATLEREPSADAFLYLGIAYAHSKNHERAEATLQEGGAKYPEDPRFHNELAGLYLSQNEVEKARMSLNDALRIGPDNVYAIDLLANIELALRNERAALQTWSRKGGPMISRIMNDGRFLEDSHWTIRRAVAFETDKTLRYRQWRTTERRLLEFGLYNDARLEIRPTPTSGQYHANIMTAFRKNTQLTPNDLVTQLLSWSLTRTFRLNRWDIGGSGLTVNGSFRPSSGRRRGELRILAPVPMAAGLVVEASGLWRAERWNVSEIAMDPSIAPFRFTSTGWRLMLKAIPDYRVEIAGGFEFTKRRTSGDLPESLANRSNSGKLLLEASVLLTDRIHQSRIRAQTFVARKSILGDLNYSGGTLELNNRIPLPKATRSTIESTIKGGTTRGPIPLDEYFVLGADLHSSNLMRGYTAFDKEHGYGAAPMGTHFLLVNTTVDRELRDLRENPSSFFPPLIVKAEAFLDGGKVFDRTGIFRKPELLVSAGAGLRFETRQHALHFVLGRSLRHNASFTGVYIEKRW